MEDVVRGLLSPDGAVRRRAFDRVIAESDAGRAAGVLALREAIARRAGAAVLHFHAPGLAFRSEVEIGAARGRLVAMARRGEICRRAELAGDLCAALASFDLATAAGVADFAGELRREGGEDAVLDFQLVGAQNQALARLRQVGGPLPSRRFVRAAGHA